MVELVQDHGRVEFPKALLQTQGDGLIALRMGQTMYNIVAWYDALLASNNMVVTSI